MRYINSYCAVSNLSLMILGQMHHGNYHHPKHDCLRTCEWPPQPWKCTYNFTVDWFYSMSVACNDCPMNKTHCNHKYCLPLNGVGRPIAIVNKMLPGPAIEVCEFEDFSLFHNYCRCVLLTITSVKEFELTHHDLNL